MLKNLISISKRFYVCEKLKKNKVLLNRSPKINYNKLFLSHLWHEKDSEWNFKESSDNQYVARHPSVNYTVSIITSKDLPIYEEVYAIGLSPLKNWLVKEKNKVVLLKDSFIGASLTKIIDEETECCLELCLSANFLSEILSKVRPTGFIINQVNFNMPPVLVGELRTQMNQTSFIPLHKGFPQLSISPGERNSFVNNSTNKNEVFCQMLNWKFGSTAVGHLLNSCPLNFYHHSFLNQITKQPKLELSLEESVHKLLHSFNLKDVPFTKGIMHSVQTKMDITDKDKAGRAKFTDNCVISIDPVDAKDLDDALHIECLSDGNFEVGVHIADVSHYVKPRTLLDKEAALRTSSIYMMHKVIPMLPEILSEKLCSLNPKEDKLTFSVIFIVDKYGTIISEKFVKSLIKPNMRLNYDEASEIIDGDPNNLPLASLPDFEKVAFSVQKLNEIAKELRKNRIINGALVLDKIEIKFNLENNHSSSEDCEFALPSSFRVKERGSSHFLIEEWMLLANQAAARLLYNHASSDPTSREKIGAVLRRHPPPDIKQNFEMMNIAKAAGIKLGFNNSKKIQQRIIELKASDPMKSLSLSYICYFNMQLAVYCCGEKMFKDEKTDKTKFESPLHHYGLNVPLYTHFTSPIRRYADILVHRQINAIINGKLTCGSIEAEREAAVENCNNIRPATRRIQERLNSLYMAAYLKREGWKLIKAIVLKENKNKMSLLLPFSGIVMRVDLIEFAPWAYDVSRSQSKFTEPMSLDLKYFTDETKYELETLNGFTQYVYQWNRSTDDVEEDTEEENRLDEQIENIIQKNTNQDFDNVQMGDSASFNMNIFDMVDCILCCSSDTLELKIQMPFPNLLPKLKEDTSRYL